MLKIHDQRGGEKSAITVSQLLMDPILPLSIMMFSMMIKTMMTIFSLMERKFRKLKLERLRMHFFRNMMNSYDCRSILKIIRTRCQSW